MKLLQTIYSKHLRQITLAVISGLIIGFFSGLIGVGGGEFRLPILIGLFKLPTFFATATNLIIGILISLTSFLRRYSLMTPDAFEMALFMGVTSLLGGYVGATVISKVKERVVSYILIIFLLLVGVKLAFTPLLSLLIKVDTHFLATAMASMSHGFTLILLCVIGFFIGLISGAFGVAGGEFRIPILMYVFGMPIKLAGTTSSLIALPAQIGGLWKHHRLQHIKREGVVIAVVMGASSVVGSFLGATLVFAVNEKVLECLLGVLLIFAAYGMYKKN